MTELEEMELKDLLRRSVDDYHWLWGLTRKFIQCKTGVEYDVKFLQQVYRSMHPKPHALS